MLKMISPRSWGFLAFCAIYSAWTIILLCHGLSVGIMVLAMGIDWIGLCISVGYDLDGIWRIVRWNKKP